MAVFIMLLAPINLCLGFALGVFLGFGPPGVKEIMRSFDALPLARDDDDDSVGAFPHDEVESDVLDQVRELSGTVGHSASGNPA